MNSIIRKAIIPLTLLLLFIGPNSYGQTNPFQKADKELTSLYAKISPFYYGDLDSLNYYSELFTTRFTAFIKNNPATLNYKFKSLIDSNVCSIVTSSDGHLRIYSWDTWLGGTMQDFNNIFQFKSGDKIHTTKLNNDEDDYGSYFTNISTLKANGRSYYLAVSGGSESTRYAYKMIRVYTISNDTLNDNVKLIKTKSGFQNSISFEYDVLDVVDRPERPIHLIRYDADKKTIYIPVVLENGKVTDRYILYQFNGKYFEKLQNKKK